MRDAKRRLEKLEAASEQETPWWRLPPGEEPDWPRPLKHMSVEDLDSICFGMIEEYVAALEEGREYRQSYEEQYLRQEAWHELRWQKHGIVRRSTGMPPPEGWDAAEYRKEEGPTP